MTYGEFLLQTDDEIVLQLSRQVKELRIKKNISQKEFAIKSGLKYGTYIKFERTGQISLKGFVTVLRNLGRLKNLSSVLLTDTVENIGIERFMSLSKKKIKTRVGNKSDRKK